MIRCLFATVGRVIDALIPPSNAVVDPGELALQIIEEQYEVLEPASADGPAEASPAAGERSPEPRPAAGHLNVGHAELSSDIMDSFGYRRYDLQRMANNAASDLLAKYSITTP